MFGYTYSIAQDTLNGVADLSRLDLALEQASLGQDYLHLNASGDVLDIFFEAELSTQGEADLDTIIAQHDGVAALEPVILELVIGGNTYHISAVKVIHETEEPDETHELVEV